MKRGWVFFGILLIFSLSIASAFSFSDFWAKMTGKVSQDFCFDTDGKNYFTKGTVTNTGLAGVISVRDKCVIETSRGVFSVPSCENEDCFLREFFCADEPIDSSDYYINSILTSCSKGCNDGACIGEIVITPNETSNETTGLPSNVTISNETSIETNETTNETLNETTEIPSEPKIIYKVPDYESVILDIPAFNELQEETLPDLSSDGLPPIPEEIDGGARSIEPQPFNGYIIEFKEEPLAARKSELESEAKKNEESGLRGIYSASRIVLPSGVEPTLNSNLDRKIDIHRGVLLRERRDFRQNVLTELNKGSFVTGSAISGVSESDLVVLGEYDKVFNGIALDISGQEAESLKSLSEVKEVYPNYIVNIALMDSVPQINADDVWRLDINGNDCETSSEPCLTGQGVTIGVIDTGVDYTHDDLGGCFGTGCKVIDGYDFVNNDNNPMDDHGHGTHVAATASGNGVLLGVAPDAKIVAYKVLDSGGSGTWDDVIKAIERSVDPNQDGNFEDHLDIVSLSLGGPGNPDDPVSQAIDNAVNTDVVAVIAAGNSGPSAESIGSPGTARKAITVGAVDKFNEIARFSSRGPVIWKDINGDKKYLIKPDVVSPGVSICAAKSSQDKIDGINCIDDKHMAISGTSMATPHVSGAAALLLQKNPGWTPEEVKMALRNTGINLNYEVNTQGYGRIDVLSATNSEKPPISILETSGEFYGTANIYGTAKGDNFESYTLSYGEGLNPQAWNEITISNIPVENGILYSGLDTSFLPEGENTLRLVVKDISGQEGEDRNIIFVDNIEIANPLNNDIHRLGDFIEIKGNVFGTDNYFFEYGKGKYPVEWISDGFTITNEGSILGTFDSSVLLNSDDYTIRLTTNYGTQEFIKDIYFDSTLKEGWPQRVNHRIVAPIGAVDVNGDGFKEIFTGETRFRSVNMQIYAWNHNGNSLDGWPKVIGNNIHSSPSFGDLNNDGLLDIVIGSGSNTYAWNNDGTNLLGWPVNTQGGKISTSAIEDIDNDGLLDVVIGSEDNNLYAFNHDGTNVDGWPFNLNEKITVNSPAIGDLNNDGKKEVTIGSWFESRLFLINNDGTNVDGWPVEFSFDDDGPIHSSPALGDLDGDGQKEIVFSSRWKKLYALNYDGTNVEGWPIDISGPIMGSSSPALGDLDGDGTLEVVFASMGHIYALHYDGTNVEGWPIDIDTGDNYVFFSYGSPVIGDIDEDGNMEVIITPDIYDNNLYAFNHDGTNVEGWPKRIPTFNPTTWHKTRLSSPLITDLDDDGYVDIVLGIENYVLIWELDASYNPDLMPWPMFQHDPQHTGCYDCDREIEIDETTQKTCREEKSFENRPSVVCGEGWSSENVEIDRDFEINREIEGEECSGIRFLRLCIGGITYFDYDCVRETQTQCSVNLDCPEGTTEISSSTCEMCVTANQCSGEGLFCNEQNVLRDVTFETEICDNIDNNCDGEVDENCDRGIENETIRERLDEERTREREFDEFIN